MFSVPILTRVALLWLAGVGMRMTILAVPPLISLIHRDLRLSETEVGILAGLPVALFACAAIPGSLLIVRFGAVTTVVAGLRPGHLLILWARCKRWSRPIHPGVMAHLIRPRQ